MTLGHWSTQTILLYRYPIDMRKGMDSLAILIDAELKLNPLDPTLFVFINKSRDKIKLLLWDRNGFWVLYKKLLKQRFQWPDWFTGDQLILPEKQLLQLLRGFNLNGMRPHEKLVLNHFA